MRRSRRFFLIALLLLALIAPCLVSCQAPADLGAELNVIVAPHRFSVLAWEACALLGIGCNDRASADIAADLDDAAVVDAYFALAEAQRAVERSLRVSPDATAAETRAALHQELANLTAQRAALRGRVEVIIARQISAILVDEGIHDPFPAHVPAPSPFPPVTLRLDRPPTLLIVSPRERIESIREVMLVPGLAVETREEIETGVAELGYSGLVEDLGGLAALYPPLIDDSGSLPWTIEAATHEWLHQYLAFTPLGFRYVLDLIGLRPDYEIARMNETVASMLGRELSQRVLETYYPETLTPQIASESLPDDSLFNRTMRETRLQVDDLLAAGRIEEAEAYMEAQRLFLVAEGYHIRKLNQAYFAFHGTYADAPTSMDPIGEEMRSLRRQVASPREFLEVASALTSRAALQERLAADTPSSSRSP